MDVHDAGEASNQDMMVPQTGSAASANAKTAMTKANDSIKNHAASELSVAGRTATRREKRSRVTHALAIPRQHAAKFIACGMILANK
jgi:hypothetical protein